MSEVPRSPHRSTDGTLPATAAAGETHFLALGCDGCHSGTQYTDSTLGLRHDVGTLTAASGQRLGQPLDGLDTPTLRGVHGSAPYLHDGSAPTLMDVLVTRNGGGLHGDVASLTVAERDALIAFLRALE